MGSARLRDDRAIERRERIPPFISGKKRFQQFQRHAYRPIGLLFFGSRHIGGCGPFSKGSGRVMERSSCMNRKIVPALALIALALSASGCTRIGGHQGYITDPTLADVIQTGVDNRDSVEKTLGRPTWISQFGAQDYYYFSRNTHQYAFNTPKASEQMVMRIRFDEAGNVIAVERRGMEQIAKIDPTGKKTQTLGRERSFLEELFGNIGQVGSVGESGGTADNPN
jgi:outer membrane protein assembly factor BamE (lipoprotein component of BamABCDE complex)